MSDELDYTKIIEDNKSLKKKVEELEEKLKTYTNTERNKKYYEKNKETIKEKAKEYNQKIKFENPEKLKEWRHTAYINRKNKLEKVNQNYQ